MAENLESNADAESASTKAEETAPEKELDDLLASIKKIHDAKKRHEIPNLDDVKCLDEFVSKYNECSTFLSKFQTKMMSRHDAALSFGQALLDKELKPPLTDESTTNVRLAMAIVFLFCRFQHKYSLLDTKLLQKYIIYVMDTEKEMSLLLLMTVRCLGNIIYQYTYAGHNEKSLLDVYTVPIRKFLIQSVDNNNFMKVGVWAICNLLHFEPESFGEEDVEVLYSLLLSAEKIMSLRVLQDLILSFRLIVRYRHRQTSILEVMMKLNLIQTICKITLRLCHHFPSLVDPLLMLLSDIFRFPNERSDWIDHCVKTISPLYTQLAGSMIHCTASKRPYFGRFMQTFQTFEPDIPNTYRSGHNFAVFYQPTSFPVPSLQGLCYRKLEQSKRKELHMQLHGVPCHEFLCNKCHTSLDNDCCVVVTMANLRRRICVAPTCENCYIAYKGENAASLLLQDDVH